MLAETPRVDRVHRGKVFRPDQINGRLDDVPEGQAGRLQHRLEVVEDALDRWFEPSRDELPGARIQRDLAGGIEDAAFDDGLGIGADGRGGVGGGYDFRGYLLLLNVRVVFEYPIYCLFKIE